MIQGKSTWFERSDIKDLTGKITYFNKFAKKFLGLSKSKKSTNNDFIRTNLESIKETDKQVINEECYIELEENIKLKSDDTRWFNIHKYPVYNDDNEMAGICVIAKDVELEKKAQEQRETYIATLTHDLQNPTLAQINALELLLEERLGPLNEDQKNLLYFLILLHLLNYARLQYTVKNLQNLSIQNELHLVCLCLSHQELLLVLINLEYVLLFF